ncbi:uncharacterized protein LOC112089226 [Eutrema salsugineum]|uniref:uncharacterized protein LOC112089226 n=1 Tax=Eutrema salsugineum TaxID=72664 RepID=UPI000CED48F6|nr:uncharacterized protein LOC112089226 [Eutrema salsugineum]
MRGRSCELQIDNQDFAQSYSKRLDFFFLQVFYLLKLSNQFFLCGARFFLHFDAESFFEDHHGDLGEGFSHEGEQRFVRLADADREYLFHGAALHGLLEQSSSQPLSPTSFLSFVLQKGEDRFSHHEKCACRGICIHRDLNSCSTFINSFDITESASNGPEVILQPEVSRDSGNSNPGNHVAWKEPFADLPLSQSQTGIWNFQDRCRAHAPPHPIYSV